MSTITNVLQWLEATAEKFPDKTAFDDGDRTINFHELRAEAREKASALTALLKGKKNLPVAVLSGRNVKTPALFLAVVYTGNFYAPLDATAPKDRLRIILRNLKPELLLTDNENENLAKELFSDLNIPIINESALTDAKGGFDFSEIIESTKWDTPLYVIHTSGSSGIPKGVLTGHGSVINYVNAYTKVMGITAEDTLGNQSPLDYIAAIRDIYIPLKTGASTYIIPKKDFAVPALLFDALNAKHVSSIGWSVNAMTMPTKMGAFEKSVPEFLTKVCFSGSVMPCSVLKIWQEHLPRTRFVNQYGPTEATASCTYYEITEPVTDDTVLPIGKPYDNYEVFLIKDDDSEIGEICVGGPVLALCYINDEERTRQAFVPDVRPGHEGKTMYRTGDLGSYGEDGNLMFHGRKDRQIKYLGHRVELGEIEEAAGTLENISECAALYNEEKELIFLVYAGDAAAKEIAVALRAKLPGFMVPRKFLKVQELLKLPNGKPDYKEMQKLI